MTKIKTIARYLTGVCALGALLGSGADAEACGGLFCSTSAPVNQAAERIVFAFDQEAGRTTAIVEILYEGPSESFAWLLPVPGTPELGVSTNEVLSALQQATNPSYRIQAVWPDDDCAGVRATSASDSFGAPQGGSGGSGGAGPGAPVTVLDAGVVGPYDYRVIAVADDADDPAREALDWLSTNGYDVTATAPDLLRPYFDAGMNLVAIRLTKRSSAGSIRPIVVRYESDRPMIPIRPTGVAANDDMGVLTWVLGASRAVPVNYKTLELNEALIDWFNPQQSYDDVVIAAANEAERGQGFVTELARRIDDPQLGSLVDQLSSQRFQIEDFRRVADGLADADLVVQLAVSFPTFSAGGVGGPFAAAAGDGVLDGVLDVIARLDLPAGVTPPDVVERPTCYARPPNPDDFYCEGRVAPPEGIDFSEFDRTAFLASVEELVFAPYERTLQLFRDHAYVTRFYTTLSAAEMTLDPEFDLNPDLADVDNAHVLELAYGGCSGNRSGPWEARFGDRVVRGEDTTWPLTVQSKSDEMPVNLRVLQLFPAGEPLVEEDNQSLIDGLLDSDFGRARIGRSSAGGCSLGGRGRGEGALPLCFAALALVGLRRRRRR